MKKTNFAVRISNLISGSPNIPEFGYYNSTIGWLLKDNSLYPTTQWASGILSKEWITGYSKSVDIKRQGKCASFGGGILKINNMTGFSQWLNSSGISLYDKKIEIGEYLSDIPTDPLTEVFTTLYTGTITNFTFDEVSGSISFESIDSLREKEIGTKAFNDRECIPIVYGSKMVKGVVIEEDLEEIYYPSFGKVFFQYVSASVIGYNGSFLTLLPSFEDVNLEDFTNYLFNNYIVKDGQPTNGLFVKCFFGNGESEVLLVQGFGINTTLNALQVFLDTTCFCEDDDTVIFRDNLQEETSYFKFFFFKKKYSIGDWINAGDTIKSNGEKFVFSESKYLPLIGDDAYKYSSNSGIIDFISGRCKDFESIEGFSFIEAQSVSLLTDHPNLYDGFDGYFTLTEAQLYPMGYRDTGHLPAFDEITQGSFSGINLLDKNYETGYGIRGVGLDSGAILESHFEITIPEEQAVDKVFFICQVSLNSSTRLKSVNLNIKNRFINTGISSATFLDNSFYLTYLYNYPHGIIQNDIDFYSNTAPSKLIKTQSPTRGWILYDDDSLSFARMYTGYTLFEIDFSQIPIITKNGFASVNVQFVWEYDPNIDTDQFHIGFRNFAFLRATPDVSLKDGLFMQSLGRTSGSSFYGTSPNNILGTSYEIIQNILRLQSYTQEGLTLNPLTSSYEEVINNNNEWGGFYEAGSAHLFSRQINKIEESNSKTLINDLCKDDWRVLNIDKVGRYNIFDMDLFFDESLSRTSIFIENCIEGSVSDLYPKKSNDIFCEPQIRFNFDEGFGDFLNFIKITNTDKAIFQESYISTNSKYLTISDKERLWLKAKALRDYYGIVNTPPESICNCKWISNSYSATVFLEKWLHWQGVSKGSTPPFFISETKEITFEVPYEFAIYNNLDIGSPIKLKFLQYESFGDLNGVLIGVDFDPKIKSSKCKCTAIVRGSNSGESGDIIELGNNVDNIIEIGNNEDQIIEDGE